MAMGDDVAGAVMNYGEKEVQIFLELLCFFKEFNNNNNRQSLNNEAIKNIGTGKVKQKDLLNFARKSGESLIIQD
ncbi:hypothetical protein FACS189499_07350 [Clostridia bacterium]|nr:hypothetical protein FACS189499_07350 [Clostridia bacterium]